MDVNKELSAVLELHKVVHIYRRELTAGEIKKIYDKGRYGYESR